MKDRSQTPIRIAVVLSGLALVVGCGSLVAVAILAGVLANNFRAQVPPDSTANLTIVGAFDDHYDADSANYHVVVTLNDREIYRGNPRLEHGQPYGQQFSNFDRLLIPFDRGLLSREQNILTISLSGVRTNYDWFCWDYLILDDGNYQHTIDSPSEWGYSPTGVSVVYAGESKSIKF